MLQIKNYGIVCDKISYLIFNMGLINFLKGVRNKFCLYIIIMNI